MKMDSQTAWKGICVKCEVNGYTEECDIITE